MNCQHLSAARLGAVPGECPSGWDSVPPISCGEGRGQGVGSVAAGRASLDWGQAVGSALVKGNCGETLPVCRQTLGFPCLEQQRGPEILGAWEVLVVISILSSPQAPTVPACRGRCARGEAASVALTLRCLRGSPGSALTRMAAVWLGLQQRCLSYGSSWGRSLTALRAAGVWARKHIPDRPRGQPCWSGVAAGGRGPPKAAAARGLGSRLGTPLPLASAHAPGAATRKPPTPRLICPER